MSGSQGRLITASERRLLTVLFTDIVGSTDLAVEMGDARWRELIARHHRIVRLEVKRFGGREIDTAGDGFFVTFDKPTQALRCAAAVVERLRELGIEIRAGLHLGEVEIAGKKVGGIAVHTGARVMSAAAPGEVLVTGTLRELVSGAGLGFEDRGSRPLKGVPGEWHLHALVAVDGKPLDAPSDAPTAAERRAAIAAPTLFRRSRVPVTIAAVSAVCVAVAVAVVLVVRSSPVNRGPVAFDPPQGSVLKVDADDGTVSRLIPDALERHGGGNPKIAVGEGGVWVRSAFLEHIDLRTEQPVGGRLQISTTGDPRADRGVEVGYRTVWVGGNAVDGKALLLRWNPLTDSRLPDARIPSLSPMNDVALGYGGVWALFSNGRLVELDPDTREVVGESHTGDFADQVVAGAGGVWVLDIVNERLTKIDPRSLEITAVPTFDGNVLAMAADEDSVWLLDSVGDDVIRVDAEGIVRGRIPVGSAPSGIAVGLGAVWVCDESGDVYRIDPTTSAVTSIHPGGHLTAIAVDEDGGSLWVAVGGD